MRKILFKEVQFVCSAYNEAQLPVLKNRSGNPLPEIAIVGRSNVGKSSLLNHLLQRKIAKTAATPGKTQSINFFTVDQEIALVDLPGYGYAKVAKTLREEWGEWIQRYLEKRSSLKLIMALIDLRHPPTSEDRALIEWAHFHKKPVLLIFTKSDKLKESQIDQHLTSALQKLELSAPFPFLHYSIKSARARMALIAQLNRSVHGPHS